MKPLLVCLLGLLLLSGCKKKEYRVDFYCKVNNDEIFDNQGWEMMGRSMANFIDSTTISISGSDEDANEERKGAGFESVRLEIKRFRGVGVYSKEDIELSSVTFTDHNNGPIEYRCDKSFPGEVNITEYIPNERIVGQFRFRANPWPYANVGNAPASANVERGRFDLKIRE